MPRCRVTDAILCYVCTCTLRCPIDRHRQGRQECLSERRLERTPITHPIQEHGQWHAVAVPPSEKAAHILLCCLSACLLTFSSLFRRSFPPLPKCSLASVMVDLLEETVPLDGLNFLMSLINAMANTSVGIDYGPGTYGAIKWVSTREARRAERWEQRQADGAISNHSHSLTVWTLISRVWQVCTLRTRFVKYETRMHPPCAQQLDRICSDFFATRCHLLTVLSSPRSLFSVRQPSRNAGVSRRSAQGFVVAA